MTPEQAALVADLAASLNQRMADIEDELERAHDAFQRMRADMTALREQVKQLQGTPS